jgi:S-layer homology domain
MRMRMLVTVLGGAMLAGSLALMSSPASGVAGFGDVPETAFYTRAVQWMVDNDITTGTSATCFSPGDPVTRGQAAAFMWRMEGEPSAPAHSFTDITAGYQQAPVSWMAANNITTGTSPSTYSPNDELTRGQLAALMHRLAGNPPGSGHPFNDITAAWQQTPVAWMVANNITTGTSATTFSPNDTVTRGQLATFFYRYKGEPPVTVSLWHPTLQPCAQQVPGPTSSTTTTTTTTTLPEAGFGPGTYLVGSDISAGTYRAVPSGGCYWERLSGLGGSLGEIIANDFTFDSVIVTISASDFAFSSNTNCGFFSANLSSGREGNTAAAFGAGSYRVGSDIAPGLWRASAGTSCYWQRVSGWSGELGDIIANDFTDTPPIVALRV